jgi:hypothetical protein
MLEIDRRELRQALIADKSILTQVEAKDFEERFSSREPTLAKLAIHLISEIQLSVTFEMGETLYFNYP